MRHFLVKGLAAGVLLAGVAACNTDRLNVPNYQNPTQSSALNDPAGVLPLLAAGVVAADRGQLAGFVGGVGELGRESYNYFPTDGRTTTGWLTADVENGTSFGGGALWAGYYVARRDAFQLRTVAAGAGSALTDAQKSAAEGFADTFDALDMLYIIDTRNQVGAPVDLTADPTQLPPFVSRDSVYGYIIARLNQAITELGQGGAAFPFALHSGFQGFDTPPTFAKFASALLARTEAYRASLGVDGCTALSSTCYQQVLTALNGSFIDTGSPLTTGVYQVFSQAAGDATNGISEAFQYILAHAHVDQGVELKPDNTPDNRFLDKVASIPAQGPSNPTIGIKTTWRYTIYPTLSTSIPVIRNEELILLRAEAEYFTGDQAGALNDINFIRTQSGGLAARGAFTNDADFIAELLYNRRESLAFEGHRWIDVRRFGQLNTLPLDSNDPTAAPGATPHIVVDHLPVPQAECLIRNNAAASLQVPAAGNCSSA